MRILIPVIIHIGFMVPNVATHPPGVLDWITASKEFLGTLHVVLQTGAAEVEKFDKNAADTIRSFEYNWLSLVGIYKGILPLISDFFFHYYKKKDFVDKNAELIQAMRNLIQLFLVGGEEEAIYSELRTVVIGSVESEMFNNGPTLTFLKDFEPIVVHKEACLILINEAKTHGPKIVRFLQFLLRGSSLKPVTITISKDRNSEL